MPDETTSPIEIGLDALLSVQTATFRGAESWLSKWTVTFAPAFSRRGRDG